MSAIEVSSVLYMIKNYCENVVIRYFCTVATNIEYDMKMILRMLFLANFAPLRVVSNILHDPKMIGRMLSWIFLQRCRLQQILCGERKLKKPNPLSIKTQIKILFIIIGLIITIISLRQKLEFHGSAETKFL